MNFQQISFIYEDPNIYNNSQVQNCFHSSNSNEQYLTPNTGDIFSINKNYDTKYNYMGSQNDIDPINDCDQYLTQTNRIEAASFTEEYNQCSFRNDQRGKNSQLEPYDLPYNGDIVSNALSITLFDKEPVTPYTSVVVEEGKDVLEEMDGFIKCSENGFKEHCETMTKFYTSDYDTHSGQEYECRVSKKKKRPNFSSEQTLYLKEWIINNRNNPYPDEDVKDWICFQTNLTLTQLNYWLINARKRYLPKLISMYKGLELENLKI